MNLKRTQKVKNNTFFMTKKQATIANEVTFSGRGLHTGNQVNVICKPAKDNEGIYFQRIDIEGNPIVPAQVQYVKDTSRSTNLCNEGVWVKTVEHLMAALVGCGIDNMCVQLDAAELPILDGSASQYVDEFQRVGVVEQNEKREEISFDEIIRFEKPDSGIELIYIPAQHFSISVMVNYNTSVLATQNASIDKLSDFTKEIYNSRTFVFLHELQFLVENNLVKGGDVDNAIVFVDKKPSDEELQKLGAFFNKTDLKVNENGTLNNVTLRYYNEPARHKLLDLMGDLYLLGKPLKGKIIANKPGHFANTEFAKILAESL